MAISWLFQERGISHAITNNEPAAASMLTRRFFMRDQNSEATTEDVYRAIGEKPASHPAAYELGLRVGSPMTVSTAGNEYDKWFSGCSESSGTSIVSRPDPIVTSIQVTPVREAPYSWDIEVRAEVFFPITDEWLQIYDEDPCYSGQYRRITTTNGTRQMKLYRVKDVSGQTPSDTNTDPSQYQWTGWLPTGTVDGETIYGEPNNYWLTRDNSITPVIGGTADPADWIGLDAGGSTVSLPIPQRSWTVSIVTSAWQSYNDESETFGLKSYLADQYVNARSFTSMFGAPRGTVKFDGVNISPMNKYWSRLDFRWTFDALAFMEQMPAKNSNGSPYVEPTPPGITDPVLHAFVRWYQPFPFLMNTTATAPSVGGGSGTYYSPLQIITNEYERIDFRKYIDAIGTTPVAPPP